MSHHDDENESVPLIQQLLDSLSRGHCTLRVL